MSPVKPVPSLQDRADGSPRLRALVEQFAAAVAEALGAHEGTTHSAQDGTCRRLAEAIEDKLARVSSAAVPQGAADVLRHKLAFLVQKADPIKRQLPSSARWLPALVRHLEDLPHHSRPSRVTGPSGPWRTLPWEDRLLAAKRSRPDHARRPPALAAALPVPATLGAAIVDGRPAVPAPIVPPLSIEEALEPIKEKFALGPQGVTYRSKPLSFLHLDKASYITTRSVTHGAFGKICYGISSDWQVHVVKVFRLGDQLCRISGKKTFTLPRQRAVDELSLTVFVRNLIDREWARHQARAPGGRSPYDSLRHKCVPFELIDLKSARFARPDGADVHKLYAVMTRETGNLVDLRRNLLPTSYVPAALSLAAQVFAELAIMHGKARYAHLDISQGNVLFNGHGQFKLMDFGLAQALANGSTGCKGLWGTLAAPEMVAKICDGVLSADITAVPELTAAVDVFTLGALIAQFASGYAWNLNPFHIPPARPGDEPGARQASLWRAFVRFELWKDAHRQAPTQDVRLERIRNGEQGTFNHFFFNLAAGCPPLCELLLNRVLVLDPRGRASAAQVDLMLRHMLPDAEDLDMKMLRAAMHRVDKRQAMEVLQHKAQKFADQIKQVVDPSCRDEGNVDERQPSP